MAIDPENVTNFHRTDAELQEFAIYSFCVAGKSSKVIAPRLEAFLQEGREAGYDAPFDWIRHHADDELHARLKAHGFGQYKRSIQCFRQLCSLEEQLPIHLWTLDDLEGIHGVGLKTARFFLLHSKPGQRYAALDTHILKFLRDLGHDVPTVTPYHAARYREIEALFIAEADKRKVAIETLDLEIWTKYSRKEAA
tara:strand:+ start:2330 stop:2914 length:585 start_codon:yes stop_codon:yes gene_type:complete